MQMRNGNKSTTELGVASPRELALSHGGPQTPQGKQRAKYNAIKHGFFASVVLEGESKAQYQRLLRGFMDYFRPVGVPEEIEVEKLAMLFWRYRRWIQAEASAIAGPAGAAQRGNAGNDKLDDLKDLAFAEQRGLINISIQAGSSKGLLKALERVVELREKVQSEGPNWERDRHTIESLFGTRAEHKELPNSWRPPWERAAHAQNAKQDMEGDKARRLSLDLLRRYRVSGPFERGATRLESEKEPAALTGNATADLVTALTKWIELLQSILAGRLLGGIHSRCGQPGEPGGQLLRPDIADQLLRYEAALERAIDRTLAQLERLQRMRLGQPLLPPVKVEVS